MSEIPDSVMLETEVYVPLWAYRENRVEAVRRIIARAILTERERCARLIERRPGSIPDRQEIAAAILRGEG